jgi:hypothetical protein
VSEQAGADVALHENVRTPSRFRHKHTSYCPWTHERKGGNVTLIVWVTAYFAVAIPATVLMGHFLAFCHSEEDDGS